MRLDRLDLLSYGHYRDAHLDLSQPQDGLTVVYGPNEAGKSTARRAFLSALFGIPNRTRDGYVYGRRGLRVGGILVDAGGRKLVFIRQALTRSPLLDEDGMSLPPGEIERFLGGVSRELYMRLFSIDHDDLRTGSDELLDAGGEIGRLVFGASLGSGSLTGVLRRLDERAEKLYKDKGRNQAVMVALKAHRDGMDNARRQRVRSRDWDSRRQAVSESEEQVARIREKLTAARVEQSRLSRVVNALPLIAQHSELHRQLESIQAHGPVASKDWAQRSRDAQLRFDKACSDHEAATARKETLESRISAISVPQDVVDRAAQIDKLVQGVDRSIKDAADLGERRGQLEQAAGQLSLFLALLGLESDDGRLISESQLTTVEDLAHEFAALEEGLRGAGEELAKAEGLLVAERRRLSELPEAPDVTGLSRALALAAPLVAREQSLPHVREMLAGLEGDAKSCAARLGLAGRSLSAIAVLIVPSGRQINEEQGRRQALATRRAQLDEDEAKLTEESSILEAQIASIQANPGIPDPGLLQTARRHRDTGWRLARQAIETGTVDPILVANWAGGESLVRAYEAAVEKADVAADDRFIYAADLTSLDRYQSRLRDVAATVHGLGEKRAVLEEEAENRAEEWVALWARADIEAGEPADMTAWREGYQELTAIIGEVGVKRRFIEAEMEVVGIHVEALRSAISGIGHNPDTGSLQHLVVQAEQIVEDARANGEARRVAEGDLKRALATLPDRQRALTAQQAAIESWETTWVKALEPLLLAPQTRPNAALGAVRAYRGLPGARQEVRGFEARIRGIERDLDDFASRVREVAAGLIEDAERAPLDMVAELRGRLALARQANTARETLQSELVDAALALRQTGFDLGQAQEHISRQRIEIGLPDDVDIGTVIERSLEAAGLKDQIARIEVDLVALGAGRALADILSEVAAAGMDGDELSAAAANQRELIDRLELELDQANVRLGETTTQLQSVGDASTAADLEQEAQDALASAAGYAAEYARAAVAAGVLRKVIADYGERHRAPMLDRAGEIFSGLTTGAFVELVPDVRGDTQTLLARRRNGELRSTAELSDGARDQLYLALRIAGIEYQLDRLSEPVPVVFDDVLVNFDDARSEAALGVLAELGQRTQVLVFTHHDSIVEAARKVIPGRHVGVVRLPGRDHSRALAGEGSGEEFELDGSSDESGYDPSNPQAILEALGSVDRPLSKAELVSMSGVAEESWPQLIRILLDGGAVEQEGQKRGAKYRLAR